MQPWMWLVPALVVSMGLAALAAWLWTRRRAGRLAEIEAAGPYDDLFDRKTVNTVLDWYILRYLEDQTLRPAEQRFLEIDRAHNDLLNRYYRHLLAREGVLVDPVPSTLEASRRGDDDDYRPMYFPDAIRDDNLVRYKHERIARRLVKTVENLERLKQRAAEPLDGLDALKPGCWPFVPDGYAVFYRHLVATRQDLDREPGLREQMRKLAAHLVFPRFKEHIAFWADKGLTLYQIPEILARDALEGWFYLDVPPRPMPTPKFLLKGDEA